MSAPGRGARPWPAPATTATRARVHGSQARGQGGPHAPARSAWGPRPGRVEGRGPIRRFVQLGACLAVAVGVAPAAPAADPIARVAAAALAYAPRDAFDADGLRLGCGGDALCAARRIAAVLGPPARVQRAAHPDTDVIRWARTRPSVAAARRLPDGAALIVLDRFGRTADPELRAALAGLAGDGTGGLVLDLRGNRGGDFGRMLRVAGALIGPRAGALRLERNGARDSIDVPSVERARPPAAIVVLVGERTASSAEVLAALLRRHAGARVLGARTAGKDRLTRIVPVDHDWRLLLPAERIEVPDESLAGGLAPDGPVPAALAAALAR